MSLPYSSTANLPQGLGTVTINMVEYVVLECSLPTTVNRLISRTDADGDRGGFMIRKGSDQIEGSMTLQRATTTTAFPPDGTTFTYDFDRSGTASTLVVKDVNNERSNDAFDTINVNVVLVTYQS